MLCLVTVYILVTVMSLVYLAHIIDHFLLPALSHQAWLIQWAFYTWSAADIFMPVVMKSVSQSSVTVGILQEVLQIQMKVAWCACSKHENYFQVRDGFEPEVQF
jgi:hypothetical protein